jgi:2,4-dienoyl-CoA reductase-like NADH-dependent reductase (Old Yellow Enzyme family)
MESIKLRIRKTWNRYEQMTSVQPPTATQAAPATEAIPVGLEGESSALFQPFKLAGLTLANRIVVAPMCQYSAERGVANDWHLQHILSLSMSGAGLVVIEANDVEEVGAFTSGCLGLWTDDSEQALARIVGACHQHGLSAIGLQLNHGGRKAACNVPWQDGGRPLTREQGGWEPAGPSAISYGPGWSTPTELSAAGLLRVRKAFASSAARAFRAGVDALELHAAHGYLLHQFLTPISNQRTDEYSGTPERRMRFPLEVFEAVREAWPAGRPLGVRISGNDWVEGGQTTEAAVAFAKALEARGCDFVCVSSGGLVPYARITVTPNYQVPFAAAVKAATGMAVRAVGLISDAHQAEKIVAAGQADLVALARAFLDDPRWAWHAAAELGVKVPYPRQYERAHHSLWPGSKKFAPSEAFLSAQRFSPRGLGS